MANENNKIKLLLLWDILSKNTDENHAMNADEIREELAKRGISVMRKVIADDISVLNEYGYVNNKYLTLIPRFACSSLITSAFVVWFSSVFTLKISHKRNNLIYCFH